MLDLGIMNQVGVTTIRTQNNQDVVTIALNVPASESQLQSFSKSECKEEFQKMVEQGTALELLDSTHNISDSVARARLGTELWKLFVILSILCAFAEMIVARKAAKDAVPAA
jgi:hypothetical protein